MTHFLEWLQAPPARSFTLFGDRLKLGRAGRFAERLIFLGSMPLGAFAFATMGVELSSVAMMLATNKIVGIVASQVVHVTIKIMLYIVSGGRLPARAATRGRAAGGWVGDSGTVGSGPSLAEAGMPTPPPINTAAQPFTVPTTEQFRPPSM